jgi:DNA-binding MarR family transcriptional regulator
MIEQDNTASQIAEKLNRDKQLISYHINRLKKFEYVKEKTRDVYKLLEITQAGKNFLDQYATSHSNNKQHICRLENIRFKALVHKMPPLEAFDWKKIELNIAIDQEYKNIGRPE